MEQIVFLLVDPVYKKFPELKGSAIALILLNGDYQILINFHNSMLLSKRESTTT